MTPSVTIASRNYGAWSLRGWLLCRFADIDIEPDLIETDNPADRAEVLRLAPSFNVPRLRLDGVEVWDPLAIAEYLNERYPEARLLPSDSTARALCRSVSAEAHAGFVDLRSALPMNLRAQHVSFRVWSGVEADIARITAVWTDCLDRFGGPFLFGSHPTLADAMYAPECTRFRTYGVELDDRLSRYCDAVYALPAMQEWLTLAALEPDDADELEMEF